MKTLTMTLVGLAAAAGLRADCPTKERPTTPAEQQFYLTVTPALKQAVSVIPAGWTAKDLDVLRPEARQSICAGDQKFYSTSWSTDFTWPERVKAVAAHEAESMKRLQALNKFSPEEQKQYDEIYKQSRELHYRSLPVAKTDKDAAAQMEAEAQKLAKQCNDIRLAHQKSIEAQRQAIFEEDKAFRQQVSSSVRFYASVNGTGTDTFLKAERIQVPGAKAGLRDGEKTAVCFGACEIVSNQAGTFIKGLLPAGNAPKVQTIVVSVTGTPQEVDTVLAGLTSGLSDLIGK